MARSLSPEEIRALTSPRLNRYIPHQPTPVQAAFLLLPDLEAFFGGAVGGGKSDALLMAALQYVDVPGYAAILFRRTYQDLALPGALIPRSHEWLHETDAAWDGVEHQWRFPGSAFLQFGYLDHAGDEHRYRSAEFQFEGFDEATQFPSESQVRYVFSRLRRPTRGPLSIVPIRRRLASNPGGVGHDWVNARYVDPKTRAKTVVFMPSWLSDNPYLDSIEYLAGLEDALDDVTLAQLVGGDWSVKPKGGRFDRRWFRADHIHAAMLPKEASEWRFVRSIDLAATEAKAGTDPDWTVLTLLALDDDNEPWVVDVDRFRLDPGQTEERIVAAVEDDRLHYENLTVIMEQEPGASGKTVAEHYESALWGTSFEAIPATGKKEVRAIPWSTAWRKGRVHLIAGAWTEQWLSEHESFPTGAHDDTIDSAAQGYNYLVTGAFEPGGATITATTRVSPRGSPSAISSAYHARRGALDMRRRR